MKAFQVLYVLCFTRPRYQVSVYRTTGPLVKISWQLQFIIEMVQPKACIDFKSYVVYAPMVNEQLQPFTGQTLKGLRIELQIYWRRRNNQSNNSQLISQPNQSTSQIYQGHQVQGLGRLRYGSSAYKFVSVA